MIPIANRPNRDRATELLASLEDSLEKAGLGGQVQWGVPRPVETPAIPAPRARITPLPSAEQAAGPNRAEEDGFPLDVLLRPTERPSRGRLIEISGEPSSGRTALAYRIAAGATTRGELVGWVDLPDALDPRFLRRSGVDLGGLLWIRPPQLRAALRAAEFLLKTGFALVVLDLEGAPVRALEHLGSAAWTRLLRAVRGARTTAVLLGSERVAGSFATLGVYTEKCRPLFDRGLFEGLEASAVVVRNRTGPTDTAYPFRVFHRPTAHS